MSTRAELTAKEIEHKVLSKQHARMQEKTEAIQLESNSLRQKKAELERNHQQYEKQFIRDEITVEQLSVAKEEVEDVRKKINASERLDQLANSALTEIESEIVATTQSIKTLHCEYCFEIKNSILNSINSDAKIRSKLIEAYVSMIASGGGYSTDWGSHLTSAFSTPPSQLEMDEAFKKFLEDHKLVNPHAQN